MGVHEHPRCWSSGFLWRVIWISLLIDVLEENLIHSFETIFGDYKIVIFMDDKKVPVTELAL